MKRRFVFLMLLALISCGAMAQNDAMYVYRNDGEFNAFLKADIDSIAHSCYDADSVLHADSRMQVIYTADSIYRIPLAAIDSISFVAPEVILNDKVFELTAAHDTYLSDCDTIRFTLSLDTPSEMRPSKGNVVVSTYDCLSFPDGIMARILSKTQDASGIHYNCEKVGLEEVYEQLVFVGECYGVEEPSASGRRKVDVVYEHELWNKSWTTTLEKGGTTTTLNIDDAARMKVTVNIQKLNPTYLRIDLTNDLKSSVKFNATNSFEKWYERELVRKMVIGRIPIPGTILWITPKFGLSGYFAEGATVSLDCNAHFNRTDKVSFEMKNKTWNVFYTPRNDAGVDVASLSMQGYMEVGLIPDLQFSICGSATGLGIETMVGIKEAVDFKFDAVAAFDEGMYSAMKDSYARTTMPWSVRAYVQFGLFGDDAQPISIKVSGEPQVGTDKYLLPLFTKPEYEMGADNTTAVLKTKPSRDLLLPVQLGMSFYEGEEKLETKYLSETYRSQRQWTQDGVQIAFTDIESGKTYTAYPTVKIMGKELRAVPSAEISCNYDYGYDYVDLGLPSGTLWATCNVGASSPEEYGDYFAWGETQPKANYNWSTYKYCNGTQDTMTKYCLHSDCGTIDNKVKLRSVDDAATVNWGADWQMPNLDQIRELIHIDNTTKTWTTQNGVYGLEIVSKKNGNSIFLPAAGKRGGTSLSDAGRYGYYWSRSLYTGTINSYNGGRLVINSKSWSAHCDYRYRGFCVRPVRVQK